MAKIRSIKTYKPVRSDDDPPIIEFNGIEFKFRPYLVGIELLDFVGKIESNDDTTAAEAITDVLFTAIDPENKLAFERYVRDAANNVGVEELSEAAVALLEFYVGDFPTSLALPSSDGSSTNGSGSEREPSSATEEISLP